METREAVERAKLVAWDTCHKIYIALDDAEAKWYLDNEWETFTGTPEEMLDRLETWYHASCSLVFINATSTSENSTESEHYSEFHTVIPQFEEWR